MIFSTLLLLFPFSLGVDVWTPFLNEEGLEYESSTYGAELSRFGSQRGGNGGGAWTDDCESRGGLKNVQMQCGKYVGSFRLQCKDNKFLSKRGLGKGNGAGSVQTLNADGITKVVIRAGAYVDRIIFYKGKKAVKTCGRSGGGHAYTATAPAGMQLCALKGRAGWWMDKIGAGWCAKPLKPVPVTKRYTSKDCNDAGEVKIGKFSVTQCAAQCLKKYPKTRWLAYGKGGRARECYCEKTRTCGRRGNHGSFDVYQINKPLLKCTGGDSCCKSTSKCGEGGGDCDKDSDCNSGLKCGVNNCRIIAKFLGKKTTTFDATDDCCYKPGKSYYKKKLPVVKKYTSADCTDAREVKIGKFDLQDCAQRCVAKYPKTKYVAFGKGRRSKECYCEKSATCSKRGKHGSFDVYEITMPTGKCKVKYTTKWPHCTNIRCFQNTSLSAISAECAKNAKCNGFSYTAGSPHKGSGCTKQKCDPDNVKGYGQKSHMYFQCKPSKPKPKPKPVPKRPTAAGCWVFTPTGCPKQKWSAHKWTRDTWGEANRNAGSSKLRCLSNRKKEYDAWCGAKNTVMQFNPMPAPKKPGCYVLTPTGCPKQKYNARVWTRDGWGEMHRNARYNKNACLKTRKKDFDAWCGAKDTTMVWNRTAYPKKPTKPGCYVFTPTGCPKQKFNAKVYTRDTWGEAHRNAGSSRSRCLVTRAAEYNGWCGSKDAQMHFVAMPNPTKSGCYVLTPTGCPKQKYNARVWTRDTWGEAHRHAIFNRAACLTTRKRDFDAWCGAKDTKMVWNKTPFPARPKAPGCYVFTPSGCPKQKYAANKWTRDSWGEANRNAGALRSRCEVTRKNDFNVWCGAKDTYMHFNPMPNPKKSGCWVLTPSGCPKQKYNARTWTRDTWGEMHRNARYDRNACLRTRTNDFNNWCGSKDSKMVFNPTPFPAKPKAPGCYVFTPTGCPKQKFNAKTYVRDTWGIAHRNAGSSRVRCLVNRRNEYNGWCGSKDAQMHFVPLANPSKPGCFVLTPTGCPKQKYNARVWTKDTWGEAQRNAKYDRNACLSHRKRDFDVWCGAKDTRMYWNKSPFPARPSAAGCYVFTPSGCPKQKWNSAKGFSRDTWGEAHRNAGASRTRCLVNRKREYDAWCGSKDTYMHFNPMANPTKPGCWALTPTGCPKQKFNARVWYKDTWGEANRGAIFNQNACLSTRKRDFDAWCNAKDTKMFWVRTPFPARPKTVGCYVFTPSGCPKQKWNSARGFIRDTWGEANRNAGASRTRCLSNRKREYDAWCGSKDTYMQFNPMPNPTKPGCWALTPTGCPKQKNFNARKWYKDIWGETHRNARYDRNACLKTRTNDFNNWCGSKDSKMVFVPTPMPAKPKAPGCYVFTPTGCPKQRNWRANKFIMDSWGIANRNAGSSQSRCLTTRKNEYNAWCGSKDTQMHFVPLAAPTKPGCWVLTPTGCPKQKYNARVWTRDTWGEANKHARYNQRACTFWRMRDFNSWCGAKDTKMHWNKSAFPTRPKTPGCYVFSPSGCPKQKWNSAGKFVRDSWGEVNRNAAASRSQCLTTRKKEFDAWCGSKDTYMQWNALARPKAAGCYVLTPHGCPKQKFNARVWTRDTWGEMHRNARHDKNACLKTRNHDFNVWCGAVHTQMVWNPSPLPKRPTTPGCYVYTPTGCPKQKWKASSFIRDTWGEKHRNAGKNQNACLVTRKKEYNGWCGAGDTQMVYNKPTPPKKCCATFYQHCWYNTRGNDRRGWKFRSCASSHWIDGTHGRGKNDHLSSVKVDPGCKLTLFEHARYQGRKITLTGNTQCLVHKKRGRGNWNDVVSSWQIHRSMASFIIEPMTQEEMDQFAEEQETEFKEENSTVFYGAAGFFGFGIISVGIYLFRRNQQRQEYEPILSA